MDNGTGTADDERPTIVVGVDGSEGAHAALGYALDDAARREP